MLNFIFIDYFDFGGNMKKIFNKKVNFILLSSLLILPAFQFAKADCDVGPVLFRDTVFGAAIGTGVGALVMISNQSSDRIAPNLATAALIGAGAGAVVGIVELSFSDCSVKRKNSGLRATPLISFLPKNQLNSSQSISNSQDVFSLENLNRLGMGFSFVYTFSN